MMNKDGKEYKEISDLWCNLDEAVTTLIRYREKGELACFNFNGHMLYSDIVTLDSAYMEVCGRSKHEFEQERKKEMEEYQRQKEEHKKQIPRLTKEWIEKGHKVLDKKYWNKWDECVPIRLDDLYEGMELGDCLDIVSALNNGVKLEEAKKIISKQSHSGMSYGLVVAMVETFCDRGSEFAELARCI